jgi:acetoin utilization protein AcuB
MSPSLETPIARIMTRDPITIGPGARVSEARTSLFEHRFHHLPVVKNGELVGIVSTSDLRRCGPPGMFSPTAVVDARLDCYLVTEIMTHEPVTVAPEDPVRRAIELLRLDSFSCLPVVDGDSLVGIVTVVDVLMFLVELVDRELAPPEPQAPRASVFV